MIHLVGAIAAPLYLVVIAAAARVPDTTPKAASSIEPFSMMRRTMMWRAMMRRLQMKAWNVAAKRIQVRHMRHVGHARALRHSKWRAMVRRSMVRRSMVMRAVVMRRRHGESKESVYNGDTSRKLLREKVLEPKVIETGSNARHAKCPKQSP
jgi:hypothetical protein